MQIGRGLVPDTEQAWCSCLWRMPSQQSSHHCFRKHKNSCQSEASTPSESFPLSFLPSPNRTPPYGDVSSQFLNKAPRTFSVLSPEDAFTVDWFIAIAWYLWVCLVLYADQNSWEFQVLLRNGAVSVWSPYTPLSTAFKHLWITSQVLIKYQHYGNGFYTILCKESWQGDNPSTFNADNKLLLDYSLDLRL